MLDTITGGLEPNLYIAQRTTEMVEELKGVRADLQALAPPVVTVTVNNALGRVTAEDVIVAIETGGGASALRRVLATS